MNRKWNVAYTWVVLAVAFGFSPFCHSPLYAEQANSHDGGKAASTATQSHPVESNIPLPDQYDAVLKTLSKVSAAGLKISDVSDADGKKDNKTISIGDVQKLKNWMQAVKDYRTGLTKCAVNRDKVADKLGSFLDGYMAMVQRVLTDDPHKAKDADEKEFIVWTSQIERLLNQEKEDFKGDLSDADLKSRDDLKDKIVKTTKVIFGDYRPTKFKEDAARSDAKLKDVVAQADKISQLMKDRTEDGGKACKLSPAQADTNKKPADNKKTDDGKKADDGKKTDDGKKPGENVQATGVKPNLNPAPPTGGNPAGGNGNGNGNGNGDGGGNGNGNGNGNGGGTGGGNGGGAVGGNGGGGFVDPGVNAQQQLQQQPFDPSALLAGLQQRFDDLKRQADDQARLAQDQQRQALDAAQRLANDIARQQALNQNQDRNNDLALAEALRALGQRNNDQPIIPPQQIQPPQLAATQPQQNQPQIPQVPFPDQTGQQQQQPMMPMMMPPQQSYPPVVQGGNDSGDRYDDPPPPRPIPVDNSATSGLLELVKLQQQMLAQAQAMNARNGVPNVYGQSMAGRLMSYGPPRPAGPLPMGRPLPVPASRFTGTAGGVGQLAVNPQARGPLPAALQTMSRRK